MKKFAALLIMLSAISFATFAGCQGGGDADTGGTDDSGETGGDGSGDNGSGEGK